MSVKRGEAQDTFESAMKSMRLAVIAKRSIETRIVMEIATLKRTYMVLDIRTMIEMTGANDLNVSAAIVTIQDLGAKSTSLTMRGLRRGNVTIEVYVIALKRFVWSYFIDKN